MAVNLALLAVVGYHIQSKQMNIRPDTDFESMDIAMLALMAAEDICEQPILINGLQMLRRLRNDILPSITASCSIERRKQLLDVFYREIKFSGNAQNYYGAENCLLHEVMQTRKGLPITLGILLMHLAQSVELSVRGICFPGNFLVQFTDEADVFIDPFTGQEWNQAYQSIMLKAALGNLSQLSESHLEHASNKQIINRLLSVSKGCLLQARLLPEALRCSEVLLVMNPDDPYEIRDRGIVYEQLECPQLAASDYAYFIEQCPKDPVSSMLKVQMALLDNSAVIFH